MKQDYTEYVLDEGPVEIRVRIRLDRDNIDWTHLAGPTGTTLTLQDLPRILKRRLKRLLEVLATREVATVSFDSRQKTPLRIDDQPHNLSNLALQEDAIEIIHHASWWIEYTRKRGIVNARHNGKRVHTHWRCPSCNKDVPAKRELCDDPQCESWDLRHACTGEPRLKPVRRSA